MDSREELRKELESLGSSLPHEPTRNYPELDEVYLKNLKKEIDQKRKKNPLIRRGFQAALAAAAVLAIAVWVYSSNTEEQPINYPTEIASFSETEVFILTEVEASELELLLSEETEHIKAEELLLQEEHLEELLNI